MINRTFVIRSNELPEEMRSWNWKELSYSNTKDYPEIPCVIVMAKDSYGVIIPYQISKTQNLREFFRRSYNKNVGISDKECNTIFYVEEMIDAERDRKKEALQNFFKVYHIV
ncbi:hypothetical protein [Paenibacillus campinasensis]|uniref:Uncharacterized protein n=1 Tax=Paenibacillus campinasensis TaxID=66347 RepID=A0A268EIB6_9BACL|nr:hypothetical protein [Paenibacillus campinasensis]PAD72856.1 hypothetical protein CHH67_21350 [Paenibacillus campinasensis]